MSIKELPIPSPLKEKSRIIFPIIRLLMITLKELIF